MSDVVSIFDQDVVELLLQTRELLDEILETMDILADAEMVTAIAESEEATGRGETRAFNDFITELGLEDEL
jgi:hypothetical protein